MGFIKAFTGAISGTFADQWKDFIAPPRMPDTAILAPGVSSGVNAGRGENSKGSENVISNGSLVVVPEGFGVVTVQDGGITGFIAEAGGYIYDSENQNAQTLFAGNGLLNSTLRTSWERFKFGGRPGGQQLVFYVNLKEVPNNRFGTQSPVYWDDMMFGTQVGVVTRGSYTLRVTDPILLIRNFVPATYITDGAVPLDLSDFDNPLGTQLFNEVVGSLSAAFSKYTNDADKNHRITSIQSDAVGFALSLGAAVEENYKWQSNRGLTIVTTALEAIDYDENTRELLVDIQRADALSGNRGNSFMQQAAARGIQAAGENGGGDGLAFMGMGMGAMGGAVSGLQQQPGGLPPRPQFGQPAAAPDAPVAAPAPTEVDPVAKLRQFKTMLDEGLITQEDFDKAKTEILGF